MMACLAIMLLCFGLSVAAAVNIAGQHAPRYKVYGLERVLQPLQPGLAPGFDLNCFAYRFRDWRTAAFYDHATEQMFNYPPPVAVVLKGIYSLPLLPTTTFGIVLAAWLATTGTITASSFRRAGLGWWMTALTIGVLLLTSEPLLTLDLVANFELFVWIVLSVGLWAFVTGRPWLAAVCFGVAGSFKYFPLAFLGLFATRADWRKLAGGIATFAVLLGGSLVAMGPTVAVARAGLAKGTALFTQAYLNTWPSASSPIDHSVVGLVKLALHHWGRMLWMPAFLRAYLLVVGVALLVLFFVYIRKLPVLNQVLVLSVIAVWLPPLSHDYTLVHLYAPLVLMVLYAVRMPRGTRSNWTLLLAFVCMGLLLAHLLFVSIGGELFGGQFRCLVLGVLFVIALRRDLFAAQSVAS